MELSEASSEFRILTLCHGCINLVHLRFRLLLSPKTPRHQDTGNSHEVRHEVRENGGINL